MRDQHQMVPLLLLLLLAVVVLMAQQGPLFQRMGRPAVVEPEQMWCLLWMVESKCLPMPRELSQGLVSPGSV
jgi:hypothetical protein